MMVDSQLCNNETVRHFVRKHLGCTCPDSVFEAVEHLACPGVFQGVAQCEAYIFGGKLLLAIAVPQDWHSMLRRMQHLMDAGRTLRDSRALNRFRLAVVTDDDAAAVTMQHVFDSLHGLDEKMHLHIVTPDMLPDVLRASVGA